MYYIDLLVRIFIMQKITGASLFSRYKRYIKFIFHILIISLFFGLYNCKKNKIKQNKFKT